MTRCLPSSATRHPLRPVAGAPQRRARRWITVRSPSITTRPSSSASTRSQGCPVRNSCHPPTGACPLAGCHRHGPRRRCGETPRSRPLAVSSTGDGEPQARFPRTTVSDLPQNPPPSNRPQEKRSAWSDRVRCEGEHLIAGAAAPRLSRCLRPLPDQDEYLSRTMAHR